MKESTHIQLEIAKSWQGYATIMIIFAGFLFTASGIFYNNTSDNLRNINDLLISQMDRANSDNFLYINATIKVTTEALNFYSKSLFWNVNFGIFFIVGGLIATLLSVLFFYFYHKELVHILTQ